MGSKNSKEGERKGEASWHGFGLGPLKRSSATASATLPRIREYGTHVNKLNPVVALQIMNCQRVPRSKVSSFENIFATPLISSLTYYQPPTLKSEIEQTLIRSFESEFCIFGKGPRHYLLW
jgi:hypothetical protein